MKCTLTVSPLLALTIYVSFLNSPILNGINDFLGIKDHLSKDRFLAKVKCIPIPYFLNILCDNAGTF
jgi:hypothetical protein